jgi:hypothetical protein
MVLVTGLPISAITRVEHSGSWMGWYCRMVRNYPLVPPETPIQRFFNRSDPSALFAVLDEYKAAFSKKKESLLVHIEGEQAISARHRVSRMTSVFIDLALDLDIPIVPLRMTGGLPVEPVTSLSDFPYGYGKQDYIFGPPITTAELRAVPRPIATRQIVDAINQLGVSPEEEEPIPGDTQFGEQVRELCQEHNLREVQAILLACLKNVASPCEETQAIIARKPLDSSNPELNAWVHELSEWLHDKAYYDQVTPEDWKQSAFIR